MRILMEACCGLPDDVLTAIQCGADRIELNSALPLGGLTPSIGQLQEAVMEAKDIPVLCMLRPRPGGFVYTSLEFRQLVRDAETVMSAGAGGLVFGFLNEDRTINTDRVRIIAHEAAGKETVFHRAIDFVPDWRKALEDLISLGVTRVLTSGQARTALEGADVIRQMIEFGQGAIEILPAGGIRPENVRTLVERTGCSQVHLSASMDAVDPTVEWNPAIVFNRRELPENVYPVCNGEMLRRVRICLDETV